jgi:hypothetical protein
MDHARAERYGALVRSYPELSFEYGLSFFELARMPRNILDIYIEELPRLRARRQSEAIEAASYTALKERPRQNIAERLNEAMGVRSPADVLAERMGQGRTATPEEAQATYSAMGFGITFVDAEGQPVAPKEEVAVNA